MEILFWAVLLIAVLTVLVGIPYNCVAAKGKNKKVVLIANGVFVAVFLGVLGFSKLDGYLMTKRTGADKTEQGGLLSSLTYRDTIGEYYILRHSGLLFFIDDIAVRKGNIVLPDNVTPGTKIVVAVKENQSRSWYKDSRITLDGRSYYYAETVSGIYRDYSSEQFLIGLYDVIAALLFNLAELPIVITQAVRYRKKMKEQTPYLPG